MLLTSIAGQSLGAAGDATPAAQSFPRFESHTIDKIGDSLGQTALADIDRGGDLDLVFKPWNLANEHICLRNMLVEGRKGK